MPQSNGLLRSPALKNHYSIIRPLLLNYYSGLMIGLYFVHLCMEKKIKILYLFTICAILGLIAVQIVWLRKQYEISLKEQETEVFDIMSNAIENYRDIRLLSSRPNSYDTISWSNSNIDYKRTNRSTQSAVVTLTFYDGDVHKILGLDDSVKLTKGMKDLAIEKTHDYKDLSKLVNAVKKFEVDSTPLRTDIWSAADEVTLDYNHPFTITGIDSIAKKAGIDAKIRLVSPDSLLWNPVHRLHGSMFRPVMTAVFPYATLEKKAVEFTCEIQLASVLKSMGAILTVSAVLSVLLIICLVWQIMTIRHLVRIDAVRNSFVHTMIHELKRPVATLKICVSSLSNPRLNASESDRNSIIDDCRHAINELSTYFSRLRDITFNESSQIPLDLSPCRLRPLVDEIISRTDISSGKSVEITNDIPQATEIVCDPLHLSQMIMNLVENAVKYSGESVEIKVGCTLTENSAEISVADNGNGISESDCRRIFDKFYRSAVARQSGMPGVGLGLAYVRLLAEAHGGSVSVESREGAGSRFSINIPQS